MFFKKRSYEKKKSPGLPATARILRVCPELQAAAAVAGPEAGAHEKLPAAAGRCGRGAGGVARTGWAPHS